jgi:hypothetical protein
MKDARLGTKESPIVLCEGSCLENASATLAEAKALLAEALDLMFVECCTDLFASKNYFAGNLPVIVALAHSRGYLQRSFPLSRPR